MTKPFSRTSRLPSLAFVVVVGCSSFGSPPPEPDGSAPEEAEGGPDGGTDGGADASGETRSCVTVGSSGCRCESGATCVVECGGSTAPVTCERASTCTLLGRGCVVNCVGAGTVCRVGACTNCLCNELNGGRCE